MIQNKFLNYKIAKNLFTVTIFLLFFIVGSQIYKDYGFNIDEKFHRANGFYWLNYLSNFFGLEELSQVTNQKLTRINDFTLPDIKQWNAYGIIFDVPAAYLEIILNLRDPKSYYELRHFLVFLVFFISSICFYKTLINRFNNKWVAAFGLILFIRTPRIFGDSF